MLRTLKFKFPNPYNSCESVYRCEETGRYYILMPSTPYSQKLCTCTPSQGYYEADCPVKSGLTYVIDGKEIVTEGDGEIVDHKAKEKYENRDLTFWQLKPECAEYPEYSNLQRRQLFQKLYDYMDPQHFTQISIKRKDVYCLLGFWYKKEN